MKFISHRGNFNGRNKINENSINIIESVISNGYDVEIDLWYHSGDFYLGHDSAIQLVSECFLNEYSDKLLIHCKDDGSLFRLNRSNTKFEIFTHADDVFTLSSKNRILIHPHTETNYRGGLLIMPEMSNYDLDEVLKFEGIISDNIKFYEDYYKSFCKIRNIN